MDTNNTSDKRADVRREGVHTAPRLKGVVKNLGIKNTKKPKSDKNKNN